jgi:hypothetical protein
MKKLLYLEFEWVVRTKKNLENKGFRQRHVTVLRALYTSCIEVVVVSLLVVGKKGNKESEIPVYRSSAL